MDVFRRQVSGFGGRRKAGALRLRCQQEKDAFRKHSGAARKRGCSKLCGGDYDIGGECPRDGLGVLESLFLLLARGAFRACSHVTARAFKLNYGAVASTDRRPGIVEILQFLNI